MLFIANHKQLLKNQLNSLRIASVYGRVFSQKLERNWGKKEKTKSTWTKKEIGERSEQRVARGGDLEAEIKVSKNS